MSPPTESDLLGIALFADPEPPPADRFAGLPGFARTQATGDAGWSATISVDGVRATLEPRTKYPIPAPLIDHDRRLSDTDRAVVRAGRSAVSVTMPSGEDPFRARKALVRVLGAVLGEHGAAALDVAAQRIWTRESLDDELSHDAPLDVEQMHTLHAVRDDADVTWLHSHGLVHLGAIDFDILRPHKEHVQDSAGFVRAMALASIEGRLPPGGAPIRPTSLEMEVRGVDAAEFMRTAAPDDVRLREPYEHTDDRVVLCDPHAKLAPKWLAKPRPAVIFQLAPPRDGLVYYSASASHRTAERARGTYARMRAAVADLEGLGLKTLVKLGYEVDGGGADDIEHLWFEVHACDQDEVEATLVNRPFRVDRLRPGHRARHSVDRLSEWRIVTPIGSITPTSLHLVREIAKDRGKIERLMAEQRARKGP